MIQQKGVLWLHDEGMHCHEKLDSLINRLKAIALGTDLKRSRICFHKSNEDKLHVMLICLHKTSSVQPHVHESRNEFYQVIEGELELTIYSGDRSHNVILCHEAETIDRRFFLMESGIVHAVRSMTEFALFFEYTTGPFTSSSTNFKSI